MTNHYEKLVSTADKILEKLKAGHKLLSSTISNFKKDEKSEIEHILNNYFIQNYEISEKNRLKQLKKYANKQKNTTSSVPFALRRNKRSIIGDMTAHKYINIMKTLKKYANAKLKDSTFSMNNACRRAQKLKLDFENTYYGKYNLIKIEKRNRKNEVIAANFCPVFPTRYIKGNLNPKIKSSFDRTFICYHNADKKFTYFGTVTYNYEQNGQTVAGSVEFAFDNKVGFDIIKNNIIANLPDSTTFIKFQGYASKARKTNELPLEVYNTQDKVAAVLKSAKAISNVFSENYVDPKVEAKQTKVEAKQTKTAENVKKQLKTFTKTPRIFKEIDDYHKI